MRKIGLLAMVLLLGTGAMAQSAKLKGSGTSQSNAEVKGVKRSKRLMQKLILNNV